MNLFRNTLIINLINKTMGDDQIPHIKENTYPMQLLNKGKFGVKKYQAGSQIGPAQPNMKSQ